MNYDGDPNLRWEPVGGLYEKAQDAMSKTQNTQPIILKNTGPEQTRDVYLFLMRHAQSEANVAKAAGQRLAQITMTDPPLSAAGRAAAVARGQQLATEVGSRKPSLAGTAAVKAENGLVGFAASTLMRAQETALLFSKAMVTAAEEMVAPPVGGAGAGVQPAVVAAMNSQEATYLSKLKDASNMVFVFPHIREEGVTADNKPAANQNTKLATLNTTYTSRRKNLRSSAIKTRSFLGSSVKESDPATFFQWLGPRLIDLYLPLNRGRLTLPTAPLQLYVVTHSHFMTSLLKLFGRTEKFGNLDGVEIKLTYRVEGAYIGGSVLDVYRAPAPVVPVAPVSPSLSVSPEARARLVPMLESIQANLIANPNVKPWEFYNARITPLYGVIGDNPDLQRALTGIQRPTKPGFFNFSSKKREAGRNQLKRNVAGLLGSLRGGTRRRRRRSSKGTRRR